MDAQQRYTFWQVGKRGFSLIGSSSDLEALLGVALAVIATHRRSHYAACHAAVVDEWTGQVYLLTKE